jgi:hypothetical protein
MLRRLQSRIALPSAAMLCAIYLFPCASVSAASVAHATNSCGPCECWIDVKTGKKVPTAPASAVNYATDTQTAAEGGVGVAHLGRDGKTAFNPETGKNYAREPDGCWIDVKTGKKVPTAPASAVNYATDTQTAAEGGVGVAHLGRDGKTAFNPETGKNYAREPCPPPTDEGAGSHAHKKHHAAFTEDDPRYMENYQPPPESSHKASPSGTGSGSEEPPPYPPSDAPSEPQRTPDVPQPPTTMPY